MIQSPNKFGYFLRTFQGEFDTFTLCSTKNGIKQFSILTMLKKNELSLELEGNEVNDIRGNVQHSDVDGLF